MKLPAASLLCCLLVTGCVLSIDAVVPASDATFDPRLLGEWQGESGREHAVIARDSGGAYAIAYTDDKGKRGNFTARLGRLGPKLVLDVWPAPDDATVQGPVADALVTLDSPILQGLAPPQINTDLTGQYLCPELPQDTWTAKPSRFGGMSSAITALDATKILQAAVGMAVIARTQKPERTFAFLFEQLDLF